MFTGDAPVPFDGAAALGAEAFEGLVEGAEVVAVLGPWLGTAPECAGESPPECPLIGGATPEG